MSACHLTYIVFMSLFLVPEQKAQKNEECYACSKKQPLKLHRNGKYCSKQACIACQNVYLGTLEYAGKRRVLQERVLLQDRNLLQVCWIADDNLKRWESTKMCALCSPLLNPPM